MGAAATKKACSDAVFDQETNIGNLALNIATAGAGKAALIAKSSSKVSKLKQQFENLKKQIAAS